MSIFQRSLTREFTAVGSAVLGVLVSILIVFTMVKLLGQVASGTQDAEAVSALLGFLLISNLPVLLALALFISVLMALSRSYRDSEMQVWFSSGLSIAAWVKPVLKFGLPITLVTALLSFGLTPWAISQSTEYQRILRSRDDVSRLSPGSFIEARGANRVFFVDKSTSDSDVVNNVFVQYNQNGKFGVVVAEKGFQKIEANGDKFLVLLNGRRYEGTPSALDFKIVDFERQMIRIEAKEAAADSPSPRALSIMQIFDQPTPDNIAELHWRIALPIAAMVLALMAIPLSSVNPRSGASWNLILAVLVFFLYYNLLGIFQAWTRDGKIPLWLGLTPVHIMMIFLVLFLFSKQLLGFRWLALSRK